MMEVTERGIAAGKTVGQIERDVQGQEEQLGEVVEKGEGER